MSRAFVHLRVHSEFSLVDSIVRLPELVATVAQHGMPAVALTDQCNLFGAVKFYKAALAAGVKPIFGADLWVDAPALPAGRGLLTVLCRNDTGFLNLKRLITRSYEEGQRAGVPVLSPDWLTTDAVAGLTALSAAGAGELAFWLRESPDDRAPAYLDEMRERFAGEYHIELQRTGRNGEEAYIDAAVGLASREACALVATGDVRFLRPDDYEVHEARVCIQSSSTLSDPKRPRLYSNQQYLRTPAEMEVLFRDLPEALDNTVVIAQRCNVRLELGQSSLPEYEVPEGETAGSYLAEMARAGLAKKLQVRKPSAAEFEQYQQRLERELEVIGQM
ncbi:MAG: PHP domain-containing protein, partial [Gammaproteobacteria bacterium]|nr:PHP domain-containing protein [Gammaproteobacteria bacterium]